jgi:hypothetical protein
MGHGFDPCPISEVSLILEREVVEVIPVPEFFHFRPDPLRLEAGPLAAVHERIGAKGAAESATLRGNVVELSSALELIVTSYVDH